jgi:trk system potassium uptake protein
VIIQRILIITFFLEAIGAICIYFSTDPAMFSSRSDHWYFAIFHSISGFCSAGFTLMSDSLYDNAMRFNYPMQITIMGLFLLGGLGFGVLYNYAVFSKEVIRGRIKSIFFKERVQKTSLLLNLNSKIVIRVSILLFGVGSLLYYLLEFNNSLSEHSGFGKFIAAMFAGATPRSAGFNNIDMDVVSFPAIMILLLYMWIGTGPASTGGGIKVTTFAVATLNIFSLVRGKDRLEILNREISSDSIKRAFAVISLSLIFIGIAVFLLSISDGEKGLLPIAFECFSAYCTVGLSLGITPDLSDMGKLVISLSMFIGRLSAITILSAMLTQVSIKSYRYPAEDIYMT